MSDAPHNAETSAPATGLSAKQIHDIRTALLSVRWAADLLDTDSDNDTLPPHALIRAQLLSAWDVLTPVVEGFLAEKGHACK